MTHDISNVSTARIEARLEDLEEYRWDFFAWNAIACHCDDFEVDEGWVIRQCPWNDPVALSNELQQRARVNA